MAHGPSIHSRRGALALLAGLLLAVSSSSASGAPAPKDPMFDVLRLLAQQEAGRTVVASPASVEAALLLLAAGAAGETARELRALAGEAAPSTLERLLGSRAPSGTGVAKGSTLLEFGSCLWSPPRLHFAAAFARRAQRDFGAVAITSEPAQAPARLNEWIARTTRGLIPRILDAPPDPSGVVLANGMGFLGKWMVPFDPALTAPGPFREAGGRVRTVPMMARAGRFRYALVPGGQLIDVPYDDGRYSFRVFLPEERGGLEQWLDTASAASWAAAGTTLQEATGELVVPRLDLTFASELKPVLERLGVVMAFRPGVADFSPMIREKTPLAVGRMIHRVVVKIDEAGTKAAASTTAEMTGAAVPQAFRMVVDHPFFFAIHGTAPADVLFVGVVRAL